MLLKVPNVVFVALAKDCCDYFIDVKCINGCHGLLREIFFAWYYSTLVLKPLWKSPTVLLSHTAVTIKQPCLPFSFRVSNTDPNLTVTAIYHKKGKKEKGKKIKRDWPTKDRNIQNPRVSCIIFNDEKEVNANVCRTAQSLSRIVAEVYCKTS